MSDTRIITVGRQFGSCGRAIAKRLAEYLNVKFYDKELIGLAAERGNISPEAAKEADQKPSSPWLYTVPGEALNVGYTGVRSVNDTLFYAQSEVIKELAEESDCVIVGRCADYVLRDHPNCTNIFIYSSMEKKIEVIMDRFSLSEWDAKSLIKRTDKQRRYYYNYYTDRSWGEMENYHVCFDSGELGIDRTAEILCAMFEGWKS